jgi:TolB-like protein/tetratricopeptide (TPR) repeat protein/tRNA A-37 threonylcarbamoyl transferase component Bud32
VYQLERQLGRGGMATVFLAQDLKHKRPVALKVLHPELASALGPERFQREVELAARLQHPHILTVLDSGEAAGQLWFTMPFVDGESLRDRIGRERQLPVDEAVRIATETAKALDYAHRQGIIHRDIKPENILLTKDGDTLVADFGIARALTGGEERLTETGLAVGTPAYMSPEQAAGERQLDARTDVYALGSVLYEMLAGEPPFTGATAQAILAKRFQGEAPRMRGARPAVPAAVDEAIARALAPVAADRWASAAEFAKALGGAGTTGAATPASPAALVGSAPAGAATSPAATPPRRRRIPAGLALLLLGFLVGLGVLFAWRGNAHSGGGGARVIAVLPFENQGDSAHAYFADAITDEVRGKLTALPGLSVIAGASSGEYRGSSKSLLQIGNELGADYLLVAKVRWAPGANGALQVRVSPELVAFRDGKPTSQWQQTFDAALIDVFQVQADIAGQVAQALDLALTDSVSRGLAAKPTGNLPAYDAFLRGEEISTNQLTAAGQRRALVYYRQAIALDSNFAPAWAQLSRTLSFLHALDQPRPELAAEALAAADRAMALGPTLPQAHLARVGYALNVLNDPREALAAARRGLTVAQNDPVLVARMGSAFNQLGQMDSAVVYLRRSARLDPRSWQIAERLSQLLRSQRQIPEALREARRARALSPSNLQLIQSEITLQVVQGDLAGARATLKSAMASVELAPLLGYVATYGDLFWVLEAPEQQMLVTLSPAEFDGDRVNWGFALTQSWWLRGDQARTKAYADSTVAALEARLRGQKDPERQAILAVALAYAGRKAEALRNGEQAVAEVRRAGAVDLEPYVQHQLVRAYILTGEHEKALDVLEEVVQKPYDLTPGWLRIDPNFTPLRGNPRFERLVAAS